MGMTIYEALDLGREALLAVKAYRKNLLYPGPDLLPGEIKG